MNLALRAGVTGGVMGTIALTTAATPSSAAGNQAPVETAEMPALSTSATQAAESMESSALRYEIQDAQEAAAEKAREEAAETKQKAVAKARAEAREKAEKAEKARALEARADRGTDGGGRTDLGDAVSDALPGSGNASSIVQFAKQQVGKAYVMGATGPSAYDCSGLTGATLKQAGVELPRTSQEQSTAGTPVGMDSLQVGDLVYWGNAGEAYHIGVYIGDGKYVGAQNPETGVVERDLSYDPPTGAVRVL